MKRIDMGFEFGLGIQHGRAESTSVVVDVRVIKDTFSRVVSCGGDPRGVVVHHPGQEFFETIKVLAKRFSAFRGPLRNCPPRLVSYSPQLQQPFFSLPWRSSSDHPARLTCKTQLSHQAIPSF